MWTSLFHKCKKNIPYLILVLIFTVVCVFILTTETSKGGYYNGAYDKIITFDESYIPKDNGGFAFCQNKCAHIQNEYKVKSSVLVMNDGRITRINYAVTVEVDNLNLFFRTINLYPKDSPLSSEAVQEKLLTFVEYELYEMNTREYDQLGLFNNPRSAEQQDFFKVFISHNLAARFHDIGLKIKDIPDFTLE